MDINAGSSNAGKSILIIESSYLEREKIKFLFSLIGEFQFFEASDYYKFILIRNNLPELILVVMDIECPLITDGAKLLNSLREKSKNTPIILTTKLSKLDEQFELSNYGIQDIISKPFNMSKLRLSISKSLKLNKRFVYETNTLAPMQLTFEEFLTYEINFSERYKKQLSIMFITFVTQTENNAVILKQFENIKNEINSIIQSKKGTRIRNTDLVFLNDKGDIVVIFPFTDSNTVLTVKNRLSSAIEKHVGALGYKVDDVLYIITVSYPDDGKNLSSLMESAYNKLESKELLEKISGILLENHKSVNWRYSPYNK